MPKKKTTTKPATKKPLATPPQGGKLNRAGRPKGVKNKIPKAIKEACEEALNHGEGAVAYFIRMKEEQPVAFCGLLKALLPTQINADIKGQQDTRITVEIIRPID